MQSMQDRLESDETSVMMIRSFSSADGAKQKERGSERHSAGLRMTPCWLLNPKEKLARCISRWNRDRDSEAERAS